MLMQSMNEFMPVPLEFIQLQPEEYLFHSFLISETEKIWSGYQTRAEISYRCHFTNQRLLFEPIAVESNELNRSQLAQIGQSLESNDGNVQCFELPLTAIKKFKEVRGLNLLTSYVKMMLHTPPPAMNGEDWIILPQSIQSAGKSSCAHAFAVIGNGLLMGGGNNGPFQALKDNPAKAAQFQQSLATSELPVLVNFLAPGCKPCKMFAPVLDEAIQPFGDRLKLLEVNLDETPSIPMQYRVECFPTLLLFKDGALTERIEGVIPAAIITKVLARHLAMS